MLLGSQGFYNARCSASQWAGRSLEATRSNSRATGAVLKATEGAFEAAVRGSEATSNGSEAKGSAFGALKRRGAA